MLQSEIFKDGIKKAIKICKRYLYYSEVKKFSFIECFEKYMHFNLSSQLKMATNMKRKKIIKDFYIDTFMGTGIDFLKSRKGLF